MPSATIHVSPLGSIVVIAVAISTAATSAALVVAARAPSTFIAAHCLWLVVLLSRERSPVAATIELLRHVRTAAAAVHSLECLRSIVATTAAEGRPRARTKLSPHVIVRSTFGAALHLRPGVEARYLAARLAAIHRLAFALLAWEGPERTATGLRITLAGVAERRLLVSTSARIVEAGAAAVELLSTPAPRIRACIALTSGFALLVQQLLEVIAAIGLVISTLLLELAAGRLLSLGLPIAPGLVTAKLPPRTEGIAIETALAERIVLRAVFITAAAKLAVSRGLVAAESIRERTARCVRPCYAGRISAARQAASVALSRRWKAARIIARVRSVEVTEPTCPVAARTAAASHSVKLLVGCCAGGCRISNWRAARCRGARRRGTRRRRRCHGAIEVLIERAGKLRAVAPNAARPNPVISIATTASDGVPPALPITRLIAPTKRLAVGVLSRD